MKRSRAITVAALLAKAPACPRARLHRLIHPPFGVIVFLLHGLAPDIPMRRIYRGVVPFLVADFAVLVLLTAFPGIALWLPRMLN